MPEFETDVVPFDESCHFCAAPPVVTDDYGARRCEDHLETDHTGNDGCAVCPGECEEATNA
jgi:hypothetical protein